MPGEKLPSAEKEKVVRGKITSAGPSGKQLANRVSNTSEEMAECAWRYALADVNHKAHGKK